MGWTLTVQLPWVGGRDLTSSSQQPPEMGFWYSHSAGEETSKARNLCLGSDLVLRPPSREMGRKRVAVTTVTLTEDAQDGR